MLYGKFNLGTSRLWRVGLLAISPNSNKMPLGGCCLNPLCKIIVSLFLFTTLNIQSQSIENEIYNAVDQLTKTPNTETLSQLKIQETQWSTLPLKKDEQLALLVLQCNLAYYYQNHNQQEAISLYEKAWQNHLKNQLSGYDIIEFCLKPLGNLYTKTKNYTQAENTIKTYISLAEKSNYLPHRISGILNLSVVYHNTGNFSTAISILKNALQNPQLPKDLKIKLENNLATNLLALNQTQSAFKLLTGQNSTQSLRNLAQIALKEKDYSSAHKYLEQAEKLLVEQPELSAREAAKLYVEKAEIYILQNQNTQAAFLLKKATHTLLPTLNKNQKPTVENLYPENTFINIFDALATIEPNIENALYYFDLSFYVSKLLAKNVTSQEAKIINYSNNRNRSEKCIELLFNKINSTNNPVYLERAFYYSEKSKATVLKEMSHKTDLLKLYPNSKLLQAEQKYTQQQELLINQLIKMQFNNEDVAIQPVIDSLNNIHFLQKQLQLKIDQEFGLKKTSEATLAQIQKKLSQDQATLIHYFFGNKNVYQFVVTDTQVQLNQINNRQKTVTQLQEYFTYFENATAINQNLSEYNQLGYDLYTSLFPKNITTKNILIIPDGFLSFLPFETLLTSKIETSQYAEMPFLLKKHQLIYNTSATFYLDPERPTNPLNVLGVFPIFENTTKALRYSVEEMENIEKYTQNLMLSKENATKQAFVKMAQEYNTIHLSTHANAGNFITPASIEFYDDVMLINELYSLRLQPDLVVLSACETGVGKIKKGEGAMSIARGFQYAGAKNLLFSLWQVNDRATAIYMSDFYKILSKKQSKSFAQHQSKLSYLKNDTIQNAQKSPYYWGSFVYYGSFEETKSYNYFIFITLIPIVLLILFYKKKLKCRN